MVVSMNAWEKILQRMECRVNPHSFATWFRPTWQERAEGGWLQIRVPSQTFRKRLTEAYGKLLQAVLLELGMPDTRLEFLCPAPEPATPEAAQPKFDFDAVPYQLNPRYTFDTFVVGASNRFARAASLA